MAEKRRKWGSLSQRNGKWTARWQEKGKRKQKGGFRTRAEGDRFLQEKELELFREGFVPDPHPLANAMEIAIESIDALQCAEGDAPPNPIDPLEEREQLDLDELDVGDIVMVELAEAPPRRVHGTVVEVERDGNDRVRVLTLAVRLGANQIGAVLGRQMPA